MSMLPMKEAPSPLRPCFVSIIRDIAPMAPRVTPATFILDRGSRRYMYDTIIVIMGTIVVIIEASMGDVCFIPMMNIPWLNIIPRAEAMMIHFMSARWMCSRGMNRDAIQKAAVPNRRRNSIREYGDTACESRISFVAVKLMPNRVATIAIVQLPIIFGFMRWLLRLTVQR